MLRRLELSGLQNAAERFSEDYCPERLILGASRNNPARTRQVQFQSAARGVRNEGHCVSRSFPSRPFRWIGMISEFSLTCILSHPCNTYENPYAVVL